MRWQLESALAADREKQWNAHSGRESESEGTVGRTPVTQPRSRKASGVAVRAPQGPRKRGDTITSSRTADSVDTARGEDSPMPTEAKTPTREESFDQQGLGHAATAETNDDDGPSADEVVAIADRPRTPPPVTPALTGTTDESEDTDFQSAYSTSPSPRESIRGNFDDNTVVGDVVFHAQEKPVPRSLETGFVRGRVASIVALAQASPTFSDDTVVSSQERPVSRR